MVGEMLREGSEKIIVEFDLKKHWNFKRRPTKQNDLMISEHRYTNLNTELKRD